MFLGEMSDELNRVTYKPAYQELSTALSTGESLQAKVLMQIDICLFCRAKNGLDPC